MRITFALFAVLFLVSCSQLPGSVGEIYSRGKSYDMSLLNAGTPRDAVLAEFGKPDYTKEAGGGFHDVFSFRQKSEGISLFSNSGQRWDEERGLRVNYDADGVVISHVFLR